MTGCSVPLMGMVVQYMIFQWLANCFFQADVPKQIVKAAEDNQEQTVLIGVGTASDQHTSVNIQECQTGC